MSQPTLDALNQLMVTAKNQFQEPIYNWTWRENPYISLYNRVEFEPMDGLTPDVVTTTSELPTSYPSWSTLALSNGTADVCLVDPTEIRPGYIKRSYGLEYTAVRTPAICLTDLQFSWKAEQTIANLQANLGQYITVLFSDWYRMKSISMINTKVTTAAAGGLNYGNDSLAAFTGVGTLPAADLSWAHLNYLYDYEMQLGANNSAVGFSEGQPLLALVCGPGIKRNLWQDTTLIRSTVDWGDAFQNFQARGINTSINGYIPNLDLYPVRYAANGTTKIYPTQNIDTGTQGWKSVPNANYKTVANGGLAVYEVFYILMRDIFEVRPRPIGSTQFGMASFNAINYVGDLNWINNKTFGGENDLGNKGYYRADIQMAAKPVRPEIGVAGLTLAKD